MINKIQNNNLSFKAKPIATVSRNSVLGKFLPKITLLEVGEKDYDFLQTMVDSIDLGALSPKHASNHKLRLWKKCIARPIDFIQERPDNKTILAVCGSKPCGIINYKLEASEPIDLTYIATWHTSKNKSVKYAGKSLMRQLFQDAQDCVVPQINTFILETPRPSYNFFKKLGFNEGAGLREAYEIPDEKFAHAINMIDKDLVYKKSSEANDVDLGKYLSIKL